MTTSTGSLVLARPFLSRRHLEVVLGLRREALESLLEGVDALYSPFDRRIDRNGKTKWRHIDNPNDHLKAIQSRLNKYILRNALFPEAVVGGVRGRSPRDHAAFHTRRSVVVTMDLADYFPNVTHKMVFDGLRKNLGCSDDNARLITKLTTLRGHLPHGAPTSTTMANIASLTLFRAIISYCKSLHVRVSFYVDDIAISGDRAREAIGPIRAMIRRFGYSLRRSKTEIMPMRRDQVVGGIRVNNGLANRPSRLLDIAQSLLELGTTPAPSATSARRIRGQLAYARWINAEETASLEALADVLLPEGDLYDLLVAPAPVDQFVPCSSREAWKWALQSKAGQ